MVTSAGTQALLALRRARTLLVGCFANLPALAARMRLERGPWLIVPACLYFNPRHMEDVHCARAIRDAVVVRDTARAWVANFRAGNRPAEFLAGRPETGRADLRLALSVGRFAVVPQVRIRGNLGRVSA
jgi:phosphosulfolactate phosphohydrolase-like enzyme